MSGEYDGDNAILSFGGLLVVDRAGFGSGGGGLLETLCDVVKSTCTNGHVASVVFEANPFPTSPPSPVSSSPSSMQIISFPSPILTTFPFVPNSDFVPSSFGEGGVRHTLSDDDDFNSTITLDDGDGGVVVVDGGRTFFDFGVK